ncbi:MAG: cytochrome c biogenesis protein CcdA [Acidimicrobiales bacterium]|jgi:cytochrome c biogenesis protein CcdA
MIELLFEGFESALLPCSLILLIPGAATAIAARQESSPAVAGFIVSATGVSWLRFSNRLDDPSPRITALLFAGALVLLLVPLIRRLDIVSAAGGLLAGAGAAILWLPCVGDEFGTLLGELPDRGPSGVALLAIYSIGVLSPLVFLAAAMHLVPDALFLPVRPFMMMVGGAVLGLLAIATAVGLADDLVSLLVEQSQ